MAAVHENTIRLPFSPSKVQLACNGTYVALPHTRGMVRVYSTQDIMCKPLELEGHRKAVSGLAFGRRQSPTLLCSAADDYVIVWNIERARHNLDSGQQIRGTVIGKTLAFIQYVAFNNDDTLVAVCAYKEVHILDAKVWDISSGTMVYQSTIISASPFISLTMNPANESFALGTTDGQVRVYDLTDGNGFRCLHQLDVGKLSRQIQEARNSGSPSSSKPDGPVTISSRPSWHQPHDNNTAPCDDQSEEGEAELGCSVLSLLFCSASAASHERSPTPARLSFLQTDSSIVSELLESAPVFVIGTTSGLIQVNARTLEPMQYISLKEPMVSNNMMVDGRETISLAGNMALAGYGHGGNKICAVVGSLFQCDVHVVKVQQPTQTDADVLRSQLAQYRKYANGDGHTTGAACGDTATGAGFDVYVGSEENFLSVLSSAPLMPNSPLKAELSPKVKDPKTSTKKSSSIPAPPTRLGGLDKKGKIVDQRPVVFHNKVKSSGYTKEAPRRTMFQPKTNNIASLSPHGKLPTKPGKSSSPKSLVVKEYPMEADPPTILAQKIEVAERATAVNFIQFSDDGQNVACALANTTSQVFKMPLSGKGWAFAGHSGIVTSSNWSHDGKWLLTSSDDKTAAVWSLGLPDPVMTLTLGNNNFGADKEGGLKPEKDNPAFSKPVKFAQFYYVDKFIVLTCGNSFSLYKYHLDTAKSDIKRYLSNNRYKLVKSLQMTDSQQISAFSAINSFHSYLALCSGSNKALEVFDMNVCQSVRVIPDAHSKAPHVICQNQGSAYVSHPPSAYDLFVTAAASDCIKLWDLRSNRCVRRYEGHSNRSQPCGLSLSPCSRFIATGSEDRSAYIFDIRSGTYLHKLTGHTDTVSDVAFHPLHPQLLTATLDGKLRLFTNK